MVDLYLHLFLEVDVAVGLEDELVKLWDVGGLTLHAVAVSEGEGWLIVPLDDVPWGDGGLDREGGSWDQTLDWDCGDGEEILLVVVVRPSGVTNLLGDTLADSYGHSLVVQPANLFRELPTLGDGLTLTDLIRHVVAFLLWDVVANRIGHLLGMSLLNILTFVVGIGLTAAWDWSPDLFFPNNLPVELAVFPVGGHTLRLSVRLQHGLVLIHTHFFVSGEALLPGGVLAETLALDLTQLLVDSLTDLEWLLLVLGVPDGDVLHPALDGPDSLHQLLRSGGSWGGGAAGDLVGGCRAERGQEQ